MEDIDRLSEKGISTHDLASILSSLYIQLSNISQEPSDRPIVLKDVALKLLKKKLLQNRDDEVLLGLSFCLIDILRIFAPEAPYDDAQLCAVFTVIIFQLRRCSDLSIDSSVRNRIIIMLSSLCVYESFLLLVFTAQNGVPNAQSLVLSFYDCLITNLRTERDPDVHLKIGTILHRSIEESTTFPEKVLELFLYPLLPFAKAESPTAYLICQNIMRNRIDQLLEPVSNFVSKALSMQSLSSVGDGDDEDLSAESRLLPKYATHYNWTICPSRRPPPNLYLFPFTLLHSIYPLIFELHNISPEFMTKILPPLLLLLQSTDVEVSIHNAYFIDNNCILTRYLQIRHKTSKLLGHLLASNQAHYALKFPHYFSTFLRRFSDADRKIRMELINIGASIFSRKPSLRPMIEGKYLH